MNVNLTAKQVQALADALNELWDRRAEELGDDDSEGTDADDELLEVYALLTGEVRK